MNHEDKYYRLEAEQGVLGAIMGFWPLACKGWQPKR